MYDCDKLYHAEQYVYGSKKTNLDLRQIPDAQYTILSRDNGFNPFNYENKDISVQ